MSFNSAQMFPPHDSSNDMLSSSELPLWQIVTVRFRLGAHSDHGPRHWRTVLRNGLYLCRHHAADEQVVRFFRTVS